MSLPRMLLSWRQRFFFALFPDVSILRVGHMVTLEVTLRKRKQRPWAGIMEGMEENMMGKPFWMSVLEGVS